MTSIHPIGSLSNVSEKLSGRIWSCAIDKQSAAVFKLSVNTGDSRDCYLIKPNPNWQSPKQTSENIPKKFKVQEKQRLYVNPTLYRLLLPTQNVTIDLEEIREELCEIKVLIVQFPLLSKDSILLVPCLKWLKNVWLGQPVLSGQKSWLLLKNGDFKMCSLHLSNAQSAGIITLETKVVFGNPELHSFKAGQFSKESLITMSKFVDPFLLSYIQSMKKAAQGKLLLLTHSDTKMPEMVQMLFGGSNLGFVYVNITELLARESTIDTALEKLDALMSLRGPESTILILHDMADLELTKSKVAPLWIPLCKFIVKFPMSIGILIAEQSPSSVSHILAAPFDVVLNLGKPDLTQRQFFINYILEQRKCVNHSPDTLQRVALYTNGCGYLSLNSLVERAIWHAKSLELNSDDWNYALSELVYGRSLSPVVALPCADETTLDFRDIPGYPNAKAEIERIASQRLQDSDAERYTSAGILLHGPPGCGKTALVKALARHFHPAPLLSLSAGELLHKHYGESERCLKMFFERARQRMPAIVFFDEMESMFACDAENLCVVLKEELYRIYSGKLPVLVIGASNLPSKIEPSLLVTGRIDSHIALSLPDADGREQILLYYLKQYGLDLSLFCATTSLESVISATDSFSPAMLSNLIKTYCQETSKEQNFNIANLINVI